MHIAPDRDRRMRSTCSGRQPSVVIFSQHTLGPGTRKTSIVFFAEALERRGWRVNFVTVQLSWLSRLVGNPRLKEIPPEDLNTWREQTAAFCKYVWVPPVHPASFHNRVLDKATSFLTQVYPLLLPEAIKRKIPEAQLVIIESCVAIALFRKLKMIGRCAKFVYFAADRLVEVGMHPALEKVQHRVSCEFDLIRTSASSLINDFPAGAPVAHIPQGLDKAVFNNATASPYPDGTVNMVIAGDMALDEQAVHWVLAAFPGVDVHAFGRNFPTRLREYNNFHPHGEVSFSTILAYIKYADLGFAPYRERARLDYLAESSLKMIQYSYARLPIVAPEFARGARDHVMSYTPGHRPTVERAVSQALSFDRREIIVSDILDWDEIASLVLARLDAESQQDESTKCL